MQSVVSGTRLSAGREKSPVEELRVLDVWIQSH